MIHTKGFRVVNETEVDFFNFFFLEFPCFLYDPVKVCNMISGSSAFPKPSLGIWNFSVHTVLTSSMQDFEHNLTCIGDEYNCPVV